MLGARLPSRHSHNALGTDPVVGNHVHQEGGIEHIEQALLSLGMAKGTFLGEFMRFVMQFKSFPVAFMEESRVFC